MSIRLAKIPKKLIPIYQSTGEGTIQIINSSPMIERHYVHNSKIYANVRLKIPVGTEIVGIIVGEILDNTAVITQNATNIQTA